MLGVIIPAKAGTYDFKVKNVDGVMIYYQILKGEESSVQVVRKEDKYNHNTYSGQVVIPSSVQYKGTDYKVTRIGTNAFNYCEQLTSVVLPQSLLSIGWSAFSGCEGLTEITIPSSVTKIGKQAFYGTALKNIQLPNSVIELGPDVFGYCRQLEEIILPSSLTKIEHWMFRSCKALKSITIPSTVTNIGNGVFKDCESLVNIQFDILNTKLGKDVFLNCPFSEIYPKKQQEMASKEREIALRKKAEQEEASRKEKEAQDAYYFEKGHPYKYKGLYYEMISNTEKTIRVMYENTDGRNEEGRQLGNSSYSGKIVVPSHIEINGNSYTVVEIGESAFRKSKVTFVELPNTIKKIGWGAFSHTTLSSVIIPNSVTYIGDLAFQNTNLENVIIPNSVIDLGKGAFLDCYLLTSATLSDKLQTVPPSTFANCKALKNVTLPTSLIAIEQGAFGYCHSLLSLTLSTTLKVIEDYAFYDSGVETLNNIPRNVIFEKNTFSKCKYKYTIIKQKYSQKYGAAIVNQIINLFKNSNYLYADLRKIPLGAPLVVLHEVLSVRYPDEHLWTEPYKEYKIGNDLYQSFNAVDYYFHFKNGKLTSKSDYN